MDMTMASLRKPILAAAMCLTTAAALSAIPARPEPARLVNDFAGIFSPRQALYIERMLVEFDDSTSNQIAVVTVPDLEGYSASEYHYRKWTFADGSPFGAYFRGLGNGFFARNAGRI